MSEGGRRIETVVVADSETGARLDRMLAVHLTELSRSRLKSLILAGNVAIGGRTICDPSHRVNARDTIAVAVPPPEPAAPHAEDFPLAIVYEDSDIIVIDKPKGLVVHPAAGHAAGTLVNALIAHCGESLSGIGGVKRPGIVHRLDKDTTRTYGCGEETTSHTGRSPPNSPITAGADHSNAAISHSSGACPTGRAEPSISRSDATRMPATRCP